MVQLRLPFRVTIVTKYEILDAWNWLLKNMSPRPSQHCHLCIYDLKLWGDQSASHPLEPSPPIASLLGRLYLASELGDLEIDFQHNITNSTLTIAKKAKFAA